MTLFVNGRPVDDKRIEQEKERMRPDYERAFADQSPEERETQLADWGRENVIEAELFAQAAEKEFSGISDSDIQAALDRAMQQEDDNGPLHQRFSAGDQERQKLRKEAADQIRTERLLEQITADVPEPKEKEVRRYYERNAERFTVPEMVRAAHIVKHPTPDVSSDQQKQEMDAILTEIQAGGDFARIAGAHSACPENGGDLGYFPRGQMVQAFEDVVFDLKPGQVSGVFATEFGWHIAKLIDRKPAQPCPIDQVQKLIVKELKEQSREKAIEQFLDHQRQVAVVEDK